MCFQVILWQWLLVFSGNSAKFRCYWCLCVQLVLKTLVNPLLLLCRMASCTNPKTPSPDGAENDDTKPSNGTKIPESDAVPIVEEPKDDPKPNIEELSTTYLYRTPEGKVREIPVCKVTPIITLPEDDNQLTVYEAKPQDKPRDGTSNSARVSPCSDCEESDDEDDLCSTTSEESGDESNIPPASHAQPPLLPVQIRNFTALYHVTLFFTTLFTCFRSNKTSKFSLTVKVKGSECGTLQLPSRCDYSADLSILAALVLSNLSDKSMQSIFVQDFCCFGSIRIVTSDLRASCLSYFRYKHKPQPSLSCLPFLDTFHHCLLSNKTSKYSLTTKR